MPAPTLFQPIQVGKLTLQHRVVLAPLTRFRASDAHVPLPVVSEYYAQRASDPGTLLISEATFIDARSGGYKNAPGIWNDEQIAAWKTVTDAVHAQGSFIFLQLWALGRAAFPSFLAAQSLPYVSASNIQMSGRKIPPRPLTIEEIKEYVDLYAAAAYNAVHRVEFDGVEIHSANGYLPDQFIQDVSNKRTDAYGGSVENRARFSLEIVAAVSNAIGPERTGIRLSPWSTYQDMGQTDPVPSFSYLVTQLRDLYPTLAYIHLVEPRISGIEDDSSRNNASNDFIRKIWGSRPCITAGGYKRTQALDVAENPGTLVAFGRYFISNPDLPRRMKEDIPFTPYDRATFYLHGDPSGRGYTDHPFAKL